MPRKCGASGTLLLIDQSLPSLEYRVARSARMKTRFALLPASSSPVEARPFIQTRAIASYSPDLAGRIGGGGFQTSPAGRQRKSPRDTIARASSTSHAAVIPPLAGPAASAAAAGRSRPLSRGSCGLENLSAAIRRDQSDRHSSPWSTPPRSLSRTSASSPHTHRLPRGPGAGSANRRSGRPGCRST